MMIFCILAFIRNSKGNPIFGTPFYTVFDLRQETSGKREVDSHHLILSNNVDFRIFAFFDEFPESGGVCRISLRLAQKLR